jgi:hypothetical protein
MFNLNDYETVDDRIHNFYEKYPDGAIITELVSNDEEKGVVIFKAYVYRTYVDAKASSVGYARGSRKERGVDRDFWVENCESSSIGRALANLAFSAKGKRPSALEMAKVNDSESNSASAPIRVRTKEQKEFLNAQNPGAEVFWDTTIEPPADDEPAFKSATDLVQSVLSAEIVPTCKHGNRVLREGVGKNGAYRGWGCPIPMRNKAEQCKAIWMLLDPSGKWTFRPEDEALVTG